MVATILVKRYNTTKNSKNMLRIFEAHFPEKLKNIEPLKIFHHSYKKKSVYLFEGHESVALINVGRAS